MGYCGNNIGVCVCTGEQLYNMEVRWLEKCSYRMHLSGLVLSSHVAELCHTRRTQLQNRLTYDVPCCSHGGLHCVVRGLAPSTKKWLVVAWCPWDIWWWEVAVRFYNAGRTFVRISGPLASIPSWRSIEAPSTRADTLISDVHLLKNVITRRSNADRKHRAFSSFSSGVLRQCCLGLWPVLSAVNLTPCLYDCYNPPDRLAAVIIGFSSSSGVTELSQCLCVREREERAATAQPASDKRCLTDSK